MVFSPESGYKFKVDVERSCPPEADSVWKLVFDLYQLKSGAEQQLVHVSFTAGSALEEKAIQVMAAQGVSPQQADVLVQKVYPAAKKIKTGRPPSAAQKKALKDAISEVVHVEL
jgi:hypothetical protein